MVKGIQRQVIVVHSPDPKLFEQAIFIIREDAKGITEDMLLKQARKEIRSSVVRKESTAMALFGAGWACAGAAAMALVWFFSTML